MIDKIIQACGKSDRVTQALDVLRTLDNEDGDLLAAVLVLVEAAVGRPRWRLRWIGKSWLTVLVEVPKKPDGDMKLGPFSYPAVDYDTAMEHSEELLRLAASDRFFVTTTGDTHGRWRLEDVPEWVMPSITAKRKR